MPAPVVPRLPPVRVGAVVVKKMLAWTAAVGFTPRLAPAKAIVEPAVRAKVVKFAVATEGVVPGLTVKLEAPTPIERGPKLSVLLTALVPVMVTEAPLRVSAEVRLVVALLVILNWVPMLAV